MTAYAFFDVDETLIHPKSMFDFLQFWYQRQQQPTEYARQMALIQQQVAAGADRAEINRQYYRQFRGQSAALLHAAGHDWFRARLAQGRLFKLPVLRRLQTLRANGIPAVLVSGSMRALLEPIGAHIGAQSLLCAELDSQAGVLSGELRLAAIGAAKAERLRNFLADYGGEASHCHAFGDHISDLPMLEAVAHPCAVDPCAHLKALALQRGWPILSTETDLQP